MPQLRLEDDPELGSTSEFLALSSLTLLFIVGWSACTCACRAQSSALITPLELFSSTACCLLPQKRAPLAPRTDSSPSRTHSIKQHLVLPPHKPPTAPSPRLPFPTFSSAAGAQMEQLWLEYSKSDTITQKLAGQMGLRNSRSSPCWHSNSLVPTTRSDPNTGSAHLVNRALPFAWPPAQARQHSGAVAFCPLTASPPQQRRRRQNKHHQCLQKFDSPPVGPQVLRSPLVCPLTGAVGLRKLGRSDWASAELLPLAASGPAINHEK